VVEHTGRRSGKSYSTPVVADLVGGDVIIPLPYGTQVDWVRNILTAGHATVVRKGETLAVQAPEIIDSTQALPLLPRDRRRTFERVHRAFPADACRRVTTADPQSPRFTPPQ
jgi:deazaflavin-dependent oxidoreductase (nitroreductase family)